MAEAEKKSGSGALVTVLLVVVAVLGWKLWEEQGRTTPDRPPTFESRMENKEANIWEGGYYFHAGRIDPQLLQAVYRPQQSQPRAQQAQHEMPRYEDNQIVRELQEENRRWEEQVW